MQRISRITNLPGFCLYPGDPCLLSLHSLVVDHFEVQESSGAQRFPYYRSVWIKAGRLLQFCQNRVLYTTRKGKCIALSHC